MPGVAPAGVAGNRFPPPMEERPTGSRRFLEGEAALGRGRLGAGAGGLLFLAMKAGWSGMPEVLDAAAADVFLAEVEVTFRLAAVRLRLAFLLTIMEEVWVRNPEEVEVESKPECLLECLD